MSITLDRLPWAAFLAQFDWQQGDHVTLLGPTKTGKTTLAIQLLERRGYVVAIGTKPKDKTLDHMRRHMGYKLVPQLPGTLTPGKPARVIVWPKLSTLDRAKKRELSRSIRSTLDRAYSAGGWCIFADELSYLSGTLRLSDELSDIWQQGRSNGVTLIGCSQRPRHIPLDAYSAASHLFLWRNNDVEDIKRLSGLNGINAKAVRTIVPQLDRHECLYVSTRTGQMVVTLAPKVN